MALSKNLSDLLTERLSLMDDAVDDINVEDDQTAIFRALKVFLLKELDLDREGNIKRTAKNLRAMQRSKTLRNIVVSDEYKAKVGEFIGKFNTVKSLSDDYITEL